jgi:AraC-like DNA-binding protein
MVPLREEFVLFPGHGAAREEQWDHLVSLTHAEMSVRVTPPPTQRAFDGIIQRQWIDDLALVDCVCDPCSGSRSRSRVAAGEADHVGVLFNLGGREFVSQGDLNVEMTAGDAIVWDTRSPLRWEARERLTKRTLVMPRTALSEVGGRSFNPTGTVLDGAAAPVRLLLGYLELLSTTLHSMTPDAVAAARNAALELFVGAVRPVAPPPSDTPALRARMEEWINRNLVDPALSPTTIAAAHGVSVRTVHRIFGADGESLGRYVRTRRLARARQELTGQRSLPIAAIASRFGFADSSHFTRAFKSHYGICPREYRAEADGRAVAAAR